MPTLLANTLLKLEMKAGMVVEPYLNARAARAYRQEKTELAVLGERMAPIMRHAREQAAAAAEQIAQMGALFESPVLKKMIEMRSRAQRGELEALEWTLERWGAQPLGEAEIQNVINSYADKDKLEEKDKAFLKRIVSAFRRGLLKPHGGRPTKVERELAPFALLFQKLRKTCPVQLKKRYRNENAHRLAVAEISEHFVAGVQDDWKERTRNAVLRILQEQQSVNSEFADKVAAQVLSCSPRLIRSLRKLQGSGKNP